MKDIDFDELDKAVSSILSPSQPAKKSASVSSIVKETPQLSEPEEQKEEASNEPAIATAPLVKKELPETTNIITTEPVVGAAPVVTPRRSGRFMDMLPPESMSKTGSSAIVSKSGRTLQPSSESVKSATVTDVKSPKDNEGSESITTASDSAMFVWSDSISTQQNSSDAENQSDKADINEHLAMKPFKDWDMDGTVEPAASDTPFINDAKVEKRPLGAFSEPTGNSDIEVEEKNNSEDEITASQTADLPTDETQEEIQETKSLEDSVEDEKEVHATRLEVDYPDDTPTASDQKTPKEERVVEKLPPELEQDIVAVESDAEKTNYQKPVVKINEDAKEPKKPGHGNPIMSADSMVSAASAMSIPQQYKEGSEAASSRHSSLFDTKEYHPPITKYGESHNHKHTLVWVMVALMLLIATAAGFGYWLYLQI